MFEQPKIQEEKENTNEINRNPAEKQAGIEIAKKYEVLMDSLKSSTIEFHKGSRV